LTASNKNGTGCFGAKKKSASTTAATPAMCTVTLKSFKSATRRMP
jgi:hypothetical protein